MRTKTRLPDKKKATPSSQLTNQENIDPHHYRRAQQSASKMN
jgi:hypothetical protein